MPRMVRTEMEEVDKFRKLKSIHWVFMEWKTLGDGIGKGEAFNFFKGISRYSVELHLSGPSWKQEDK